MFDHTALKGGTFSRFNEKDFSTIRFYQFPFFSYDSMIGYDDNLSEKENFRLKIGAGTVYNLSGRGIGKTIIEKLNMMHTISLEGAGEMGIESYDSKHVVDVLEPGMQAYENHPILKKFSKQVKRGQQLLIINQDDLRFYGINADVSGGLSAGDNLLGKHFKKLFIEEFSKENKIVYNKRQESSSDEGIIINASGMCDFLKHSPTGKMFYKIKNKKYIVNLPKMVLENWDEKEKEASIERYGSPDDINYKIYVLGQPVEEGTSAFDEQRIRLCYTKEEIKHFEINKDNFENYILITAPILRPKNSDEIWIIADIGTSSQTKILIFSKLNNVFHYIYKITLFGIINPQLEPFFDHLITKLKANLVGIDAGDGDGRNLYWYLEGKYDKKNLFEYQGAENIGIGIAKDEMGNPKFTKNGEYEFVYEKQHRWGAEMIKKIFYESRILCPQDYELDTQLSSIIAIPRTNGITYHLSSENDHLWNALKVFGCAVWDKDDFVLDNLTTDDFKGFV